MIDLRNGIDAKSAADASAGFEDPATLEAGQTDAGRANLLAWSRGEGTLEDRLKLIRYRNWHSPLDVMDDEAGVLRQLMAMPESFDRTLKIQAFFGSPKVFRRCWKAYAEWADPKLVSEAESAYRKSVGL